MIRYFYYGRALLQLLSNGEHFRHTVITQTEEELDFKLWATEGLHLFFDIDDTLNRHGQGLSPDICSWLDSLLHRAQSVNLLTNCSPRRAREHLGRLSEYNCKAELWPHGRKPHYSWLKQELSKRGWQAEDCAMYGDRPTMDLWMAWKAGFRHRVWVKAWAKERRTSTTLLQSIQNFEHSKLN